VGKNIVITGGGTGIGKAIGIAFAQAGAKSVAIIGRRQDRLEAAAQAIQDANPSTFVLFGTGDVTKFESIEASLSRVLDRAGKIDIFVANAGILPSDGQVSNYDETEFRRSFETNVIGAFNSVKAFLPCAASGAKLFNVGTCLGHLAPLPEIPGVFSYAAAKAAALKIFDFFAAENPGIHVVSIQPGIIATEINPKITEGPDQGMSHPRYVHL
jgi:NAD(P)-dependent dehydrogenase (short-subunit alcohol dehydrogenase family)